ncbi:MULTISPECIES: bifunctional diguanylate cyclase/phosphodiesterase [Bradyrhizobium]|uniref:bifunctional diguanylate cyclase/phosphodiesterase n=1 Tax=Bradyrhizobium TaxID=374 RepID=UPI00067EC168|nr:MULTISPECIES: EAL domain-containing protein [Bradyrhizobium]PAY04380.1 bifunctional diguanylate cyclase/phosphodiesterase [Bradyrhizobium sp. UFLA03-84]
MYRVFTCLTLEHDWRLVVLGGVICLLASAVAISLFHRARAAQGRAREIWIGLDAAVGGCGIWATHFVAMLAYDPGIEAGYNIPITLLSLVLAVAILAIGLAVATLNERWPTVAAGGAIVGVGVAAMHYTGMLGLELPARVVWSPGIVFASIAFGSLFGALALVVATRGERLGITAAATGLLTVAIVSHHFTAMGAVTLFPDPTIVPDGLSVSPRVLSFMTAVAAFAILGLSLIASILDRRAKTELHKQKVVLDTALENMSQGLCMFDADGRIMLFNERYSEMMGRSRVPLQGRLLIDVLQDLHSVGEWDGDPEELCEALIAEAKAGNSGTRIISRNERAIRVVDQPMKGGGWVATFEDITEWQQAQEQISHMARHDALTNLPNRTLFREQLEKASRLAKRSDQLAVLCLDLDHFKEINDTLGHPIGDALLREVARRLGECVTEHDTVARLGGDEFAIVQFCSNCEPSVVSSLASVVVERIAAPYEIEGHQLVIGVSIGISLAPEDGKDPDELLQKADLALYRAKADGRGTYRFFETGMDARAQARRLLERDLRLALEHDEFEVYYQPIRDVEGDRVVAFEALARWNHSLRGLIAPNNFIPVAEETGLIVPLGEIVLRKACAEAARWPADIAVAVNLSPVQFKNPNLVSSVRAALDASGLSPDRLELEITESVLLQNSEATLTVLHELRGFGVRISLDDFGTGYSSLSYLRSFPFDKIKIDRSFVTDLATREDSMAIVRAVTGLGKSLGIVTTAEGVETDTQFDLLRQEGCTQAQGYLFSPPRPAADVAKMLHRMPERSVA